MDRARQQGSPAWNWRAWWLTWLVALVCAGTGCDGLGQASEARHLTDALTTQFAAAVDAANRAVMGSNAEAAAGFVEEAEKARNSVKQTENRLSALLRERGYVEEGKLLQDFHGKFAAYEVLDRSILELALEKTNAQAARLSFGSAAETAEAFKGALSALVTSAARADACRIRALSAEAVLAIREVQVLEAPHIAEPTDEVMTRLEARMHASETKAREALAELGTVVGSEALVPAEAAMTGFLATHAQIVSMSRRNTEVRSLAMTLGEKRQLVLACQDSLQALARALTERLSKPTR